ncbi:Xaa-Pro dipeptidase [Rosenbergiella australiborealis]|uniref:Xaa-Pro dipeptidase n=1 Tax=Rosenbergiella australiborealis TaxID=1544696 RepID=UPI001F4E9756|nr:Xaa-Pro dipeptidase [Rosenbergiella australiborealis]
MNSLPALYRAHLDSLIEHARIILARSKRDALLVHSGELITAFQDDHAYPFKVNPLFKAWLPIIETANCWLWIDGQSRPTLYFYSPTDYWHKVDPLPDTYWSREFEIIVLKHADDIATLLPSQRENIAYLGSALHLAQALGIPASQHNPQEIINYLHYHRSVKTDYELYCMREAQRTAVVGHLAARDSFFSGASEFQINSDYLAATGQRDTTVPYGNIVAINEHAAVLHYTHLDHARPQTPRSFLLDAGTEYQGYAADLTRSYAWDAQSRYAELVNAVTEHERALIDTLQAGQRYSDYHLQMNQRIARILCEFGIVNNISEEALVSENITSTFMPHGVGHLLGLQVHDVAGFMQDDCGTHLAAPNQYPWLRCTRILAPRMVLTIEPGLYFIESLLAPWRNSAYSRHFNWTAIEELKGYGGIRIEDNIVVWPEHIENMTRDLQLP